VKNQKTKECASLYSSLQHRASGFELLSTLFKRYLVGCLEQGVGSPQGVYLIKGKQAKRQTEMWTYVGVSKRNWNHEPNVRAIKDSTRFKHSGRSNGYNKGTGMYVQNGNRFNNNYTQNTAKIKRVS